LTLPLRALGLRSRGRSRRGSTGPDVLPSLVAAAVTLLSAYSQSGGVAYSEEPVMSIPRE
jgi:hypothetical protein